MPSSWRSRTKTGRRLYDIPAEESELGEDAPDGPIGASGPNDFGRTGCGGALAG